MKTVSFRLSSGCAAAAPTGSFGGSYRDEQLGYGGGGGLDRPSTVELVRKGAVRELRQKQTDEMHAALRSKLASTTSARPEGPATAHGKRTARQLDRQARRSSVLCLCEPTQDCNRLAVLKFRNPYVTRHSTFRR